MFWFPSWISCNETRRYSFIINKGAPINGGEGQARQTFPRVRIPGAPLKIISNNVWRNEKVSYLCKTNNKH
jgi:hypothetical protein